MSIYTPDAVTLIEEAQRWHQALQQGGASERAAFVAWIRRSPQHLQAYLQHLALAAEIDGLDGDRELDLEALLERSSSKVVHLTPEKPALAPSPDPSVRARRPWRCPAAVAATGVLAACCLWIYYLANPEWSDYKTGTGEQRRIALRDGSIIELNTQSHIRISSRAHLREVELLSGEALFNIHHDETRPFRVHAADNVIEDLGTEFSIYVRPDASTTVSVLEGRIQIFSKGATQTGLLGGPSASTNTQPGQPSGSYPTQVSAGEEVRIAHGAPIKRVSLNVTEATAPWRGHRLWFDNATLAEVAAEFNRYNARKIQVASDPALLKKRYTATFDAYDPESFVAALRDDPALVVESNDERMLIQAR